MIDVLRPSTRNPRGAFEAMMQRRPQDPAVTSPRVRVIKVGGSLLELPDLVPRVRRWLVRQSTLRSYLLLGGGQRVDALRRDAARWDDETAHWMCLEAMDVNAQEFADSWSSAPPISRWDGLYAPDALAGMWHQLGVLLPCRLLTERARRPMPCDETTQVLELPVGWHVTSDSIAAYFAQSLGADELVLLKSCLPPVRQDGDDQAAHIDMQAELQSWQQAGYVDPYFSAASARLPRVRCVNLRQPEFPEVQCEPF